MRKPIVSVIILAYNHSQYISQAIESCLMQQTSFSVEIIIGEDESSDGTREICQGYTDQYPDRIRLILRSRKDVIFINGKPTGRYNLIQTLGVADGKYITLLDGDDYWTDPLKLQKQVDFLEANPTYSACFHDSLNIYTQSNKSFSGAVRSLGEHRIGESFSLERKFLVESNFGCIHTSSIVFKQELLSLPPFFNQLRAGDKTIYMALLGVGDFGFIYESMSVRRRDVGMSTNWKVDCKMVRSWVLRYLLFVKWETDMELKVLYTVQFKKYFKDLTQIKTSGILESVYKFWFILMYGIRFVLPSFENRK